MTAAEQLTLDAPDRPTVDLRHGDCLAVLRTLPDCSVEAIITDPPYGLADHKPAVVAAALAAWLAGDREHVPDQRGFMGRAWDAFVPPPAVWDECLRVLRPGGHLLAFAGTRTVDLMGLSIRLAGFEFRDSIGSASAELPPLMAWMTGQGFPKSLNVGAAVMKGQGLDPLEDEWTPEAEQWRGHGTSLKPAWEPIIVARRPLSEKSVAANVLAHGTGGLNVDATRVTTSPGDYAHPGNANSTDRQGMYEGGRFANRGRQIEPHTAGRWPANVVLVHGSPGQPCPDDRCEPGCVVAELDGQSGTLTSGAMKPYTSEHSGRSGGIMGEHVQRWKPYDRPAESGGASRFFPAFRYQAKAPASERPKIDGQGFPCVKPLALMRWLVRLVTPPGGLVLDCFAGTGTTLQAAELEGFDSLGIERDPFAYALACQRLGIAP